MAAQNINTNTDFLLLEQFRDKDRNPAPIPEGNWRIIYFTDAFIYYVASRIDGVYRNCYRAGEDQIVVAFDNHKLGVGRLRRSYEVELDNGMFPDEIENVQNYLDTEYFLVDGPTTATTTALTDLEQNAFLATLITAFMKGPKGDVGYSPYVSKETGTWWTYDPETKDFVDTGVKAQGEAFTYDDFTEEQIEELQRPATEATERANAAAENADGKAAKANNAAENADNKASRADASANEADTAAERANNAAGRADASAENADTSAGNADNAKDLANAAAENADSKAALADTAADEADLAAERANNAAESIEGRMFKVLNDPDLDTITERGTYLLRGTKQNSPVIADIDLNDLNYEYLLYVISAGDAVGLGNDMAQMVLYAGPDGDIPAANFRAQLTFIVFTRIWDSTANKWAPWKKQSPGDPVQVFDNSAYQWVESSMHIRTSEQWKTMYPYPSALWFVEGVGLFNGATPIANAVMNLPVNITGTANTPVYSFTADDFNKIFRGSSIVVQITDNRTSKDIDLSGDYPAKWNPVLSQIEVADPCIARGFYLNGTTPANRGCVTINTRKYIDLGKCWDDTLSCKFNATTGFYEMAGLTDLTERDMEESAKFIWYSHQHMGSLCAWNNKSIRVNFPVQYYWGGVTNNDRGDNLAPGIGMFRGNPFPVLNLIPSNAFNIPGGGYYIITKSNVGAMFYFAQTTKVHGIIDINAVTAPITREAITATDMDVKFYGLKVNWNWSYTNILKSTLVYLLANRANAVGTTITITLTAASYAWASVDDDVLALLPATATQDPVTLASAQPLKHIKMKNITERTIELKEYTAPEGQVFKKVETSVNDKGETVENISYMSRMMGTDIDLEAYALVPVAERDEYLAAQEKKMEGM